MLVIGSSAAQTQLIWMDRAGKRLELVGEASAGNLRPRLSPDETQVAYTPITGDNTDIWVRDLARGVPTHFTFDPGIDT